MHQHASQPRPVDGWTDPNPGAWAPMPRRLLGELSHAEFTVAYALATFANVDGVCWPSSPTLARVCRMSERAVRAILDALIARRLVVVDDARPGRVRRLRCAFLTVHNPAGDPRGSVDDPAGDPRGTPRVSRGHPAGEPRRTDQGTDQGTDHSARETSTSYREDWAAGCEVTDEGRAIAARVLDRWRRAPGEVVDGPAVVEAWAALRWRYRDDAAQVRPVDLEALVRGAPLKIVDVDAQVDGATAARRTASGAP